MRRSVRLAACGLVALGGAVPCSAAEAEHAGQAAPVAPWMSLSATASAEADVDRMTVRLRATRDGRDAGEVQRALQQSLAAALQRTASEQRSGELDVHSGEFSLTPRRGPQGELVGWTGTADLVIEGSDLAAVARLAGRTTELPVAQVAYGLSPARRAQTEARASADAIAGFRMHATACVQAFGYGRYVLHDVDVSADQSVGMPVQPFALRAKAADAEPLPVQPGHTTVTVTVRGTVELLP